MRIREAFIFAVYAALVEWLIYTLPFLFVLPSLGSAMALPRITTLAGVFLVALLYLRKHALNRPWQGALLGALSVIGAYLVTVLLLMATVTLHNSSGGPGLGAAGGFGIVSLIMAAYVLPGLIALGAVAGAIYVPIKRRLRLFGAVPAAPPQGRRRSATFWVAAVLGLVVVAPMALIGAPVVVFGIFHFATTSGPHCKKVEPIIVRVGDRIFTVVEADQPSLLGETIRSAGSYRFCQERPPNAPFTADSVTLHLKPQRLGYESKQFGSIELRISTRARTDTEWSSFQRAQDRMNKSGLTLIDLPRNGGFLTVEDSRWRYFIAINETATTPTGQPVTFWCDMVETIERLGRRCSAFYAWSEKVHFVLNFYNKPFAPEEWLALHEAVRQFLTDAESHATHKSEE